MKFINYKGQKIEVRGGSWCDFNNGWLYTVIDCIPHYEICKERDIDGGNLFALWLG